MKPDGLHNDGGALENCPEDSSQMFQRPITPLQIKIGDLGTASNMLPAFLTESLVKSKLGLPQKPEGRYILKIREEQFRHWMTVYNSIWSVIDVRMTYKYVILPSRVSIIQR